MLAVGGRQPVAAHGQHSVDCGRWRRGPAMTCSAPHSRGSSRIRASTSTRDCVRWTQTACCPRSSELPGRVVCSHRQPVVSTLPFSLRGHQPLGLPHQAPTSLTLHGGPRQPRWLHLANPPRMYSCFPKDLLCFECSPFRERDSVPKCRCGEERARGREGVGSGGRCRAAHPATSEPRGRARTMASASAARVLARPATVRRCLACALPSRRGRLRPAKGPWM